MQNRDLDVIKNIRRYIQDVATDIGLCKYKASTQHFIAPILMDCPAQEEGWDCGVFVAMFAKYVASNTPANWGMDDIANMRVQMLCKMLDQHIE